MKPEEHALRLRLVPHIIFRVILGGQRVVLGEVQTFSICGDAGCEDVASKAGGGSKGCRFHLFSGRPPLPVVDVVVDDVEPHAVQLPSDVRRVVAVTENLRGLTGKRLLRPAMQNRNVITTSKQAPHERPPNEECASDNESAVGSPILHFSSPDGRSTRKKGRDSCFVKNLEGRAARAFFLRPAHNLTLTALSRTCLAKWWEMPVSRSIRGQGA